MSNVKIEADNNLGNEILSNYELQKSVKRNTKATVFLGGTVAVALLAMMGKQFFPSLPLVLESETGNIIANYSHALDQRSLEERELVATWAYRGLRERTGIKEIDGERLNDWRMQITRSGVLSWTSAGDRWKDINTVKPGFRRVIQIVSSKPDLSNAYAFNIEAVEVESQDSDPRTMKRYRVRLTLFFTDPKIDGVSMINAVSLNSEEQI